jgi:hypothetical protein
MARTYTNLVYHLVFFTRLRGCGQPQDMKARSSAWIHEPRIGAPQRGAGE